MICETLTPEPSAELSLDICAFPPELLARVLKLLVYCDILRATMVCKQWNSVVRGDPEIAQLLYKTICRSIVGLCVFCAKATNARGVTGLDVLQAIVRECLVIDSPVLTLRSNTDVTNDMVDLALQGAFTPDKRKRRKWLNKADCLEGFRRYEGLEATRDGLRVNAVARLSSQPVAGEVFGLKQESES
ncbi:hypothetical protein B0H13DRAFT_1898330 [Mycena leptocephala]|nr:hypothetical protein B0H13DRAFT_1898330 [Mycena leptocephala]